MDIEEFEERVMEIFEKNIDEAKAEGTSIMQNKLNYNINDEVYINYKDGVMKVKIKDIRGDKYIISVKRSDLDFEFRENEVSSNPKIIEGVAPIVGANHLEE